MSLRADIPAVALFGLAACVSNEGAAPAGTPASLDLIEKGGVIEVTGAMPTDGADAHFHCRAGRAAKRLGASEMDWIEGVVQMRAGRAESATYRYFIGPEGQLPAGLVDKVIGGPQPVDRFLFDCSGFPPEGNA